MQNNLNTSFPRDDYRESVRIHENKKEIETKSVTQVHIKRYPKEGHIASTAVFKVRQTPLNRCQSKEPNLHKTYRPGAIKWIIIASRSIERGRAGGEG